MALLAPAPRAAARLASSAAMMSFMGGLCLRSIVNKAAALIDASPALRTGPCFMGRPRRLQYGLDGAFGRGKSGASWGAWRWASAAPCRRPELLLPSRGRVSRARLPDCTRALRRMRRHPRGDQRSQAPRPCGPTLQQRCALAVARADMVGTEGKRLLRGIERFLRFALATQGARQEIPSDRRSARFGHEQTRTFFGLVIAPCAIAGRDIVAPTDLAIADQSDTQPRTLPTRPDDDR